MRGEKCRWGTVELGDNIDFAHNLAVSHGISAHPSEYTWYMPRDNVLSPLEKIELAFYTDYSEMSIL